MRTRAVTLLVVTSIVVTACDNPGACTLGIEPAIEIVVNDSITGEAAATDAVGILIMGSEQLPMSIVGVDPEGRPNLLAGGGEPGEYDVRVEKSGYETWRRDGIEVESNNCGLITERFEARLQPAG